MKLKTKKILAILILTTMVLTMVPITNVFAEGDPSPEFVIDHNLVMKRNQNSTLNVTVNEKLEFVSFKAILDCEGDGVEITGIEKGQILPEYAQVIAEPLEENTTRLEIISNNGEPIKVNAGEIMRIKVETKNDATLGKYRIVWNETELISDDNREITITTIPGDVIVTEEGTNIDKAEFSMIYTKRMSPGEEQTISVKNDDKMNFRYIQTLFLYDENIEVEDVEKGKDLPNDAEISIIRNSTLGSIVGFSISSDNIINIDQNSELARIKIKTDISATPEEAEFAIDWNYILNKDWNEVIADDTIANIEIEPQVSTQLKGIEFTDSRIEISRGTEFKMQYKLTPENISPIPKIEWITANKDVATVDSNGVVTAVGVGETTITAKVGEYTATAQIIVTEKPEEKFIINMSRTQYVVGETDKIEVKVEPEYMAGDINITYGSSDESIAIVNEKGEINFLRPGRVRLSVYIDGNLEKTFDIEVTKAVVPATGDINIIELSNIMIISIIGLVISIIIKSKNKR